MQDDCLDVSNKPFYKRRNKLIPPPRGASFRAQKIALMLTWRLYYGGAVITSITVVVFVCSSFICLGYLSILIFDIPTASFSIYGHVILHFSHVVSHVDLINLALALVALESK